MVDEGLQGPTMSNAFFPSFTVDLLLLLQHFFQKGPVVLCQEICL